MGTSMSATKLMPLSGSQQMPKMTTMETQSRLFLRRRSFSASSLAADRAPAPGREMLRFARRAIIKLRVGKKKEK